MRTVEESDESVENPSTRDSRRTPSPHNDENEDVAHGRTSPGSAPPFKEEIESPAGRGPAALHNAAGSTRATPPKKGDNPLDKPLDKPKQLDVEEVEEDDLDEDFDFEEEARDVLEEILDLMRLHVNVEEEEAADGQPVLNIVGPDQGILIGKHGQTLDALQFVVNLIVNKETTERRRITLDAGGYRLRREKTLKDLAWRMARRALDDRCQIALEPMGAAERRIIHLALADDPDIETFSEGEEPMRKVIISPRR